MKNKILALCLALALLLCSCAGRPEESAAPISGEPPPAQSGRPPGEIWPQLARSSGEESLAEGAPTQEYTWEDRGSGSFVENGESTAAQRALILRFMDYYYDSLAHLRLREPDELFAPEAAVSLAGNRTVWEYLVELRAMQEKDFSLSSYLYELSCDSVEYDETGESVSIQVTEDSVQNFVAYPGVEAELFRHIHRFTLEKQPNGMWKIASHMQMGSLYWMVLGRYAFRRAEEGGEPPPESGALRYFEERKAELIADARAAAAARSREELAAPTFSRAYDREAAVAYALEWAGGRSAAWPDYSRNGGNCQNYTSQCLLAGGIPMDIQSPGVWKWYGPTPDALAHGYGRSPSWSSVNDFLAYVEKNQGYGLVAKAGAPYYSAEPGDILHLGSDPEDWRHTVIVTDVLTDGEGRTEDYLVCSNTADLKNFPASIYPYAHQMLIKIYGWNSW